MIRWGCAAILAVPAMLVIALVVATGPADLSQYPPRESSPYLLPYPAGARLLCVQGNRGVVSHRGDQQFGYDFYMPVGSPIVAARAGKVTRVVTEYDGHGYQWPNNLVIVEHEDGTRAYYAHIKQGGSLVREGEWVAQGQAIALSGNVGNSMMPHLHFHVTDPESRATIPVTFADVHNDRGIPRMFKWYTSGNTAPPESERKEASNE